tara:strand:- start:28 stop:660 length:633 start_codon:yes stop_codon:yes gene_type:complete
MVNKLIELLNLNKMKYSDTISEKHQNSMDMETEILDEVKIPLNPFPENSSKKTYNELVWIKNYNEGVIDKEYSKKGDDIEKVFENYCKEHNLEYDKKYFKKLRKESSKIILQLKYKYNRPRPYQLAEFYEIPDFNIHKLDSGNTPSYPSGHSTQGYLFAELLGRDFPRHRSGFRKLAEFISKSRIMARIHYPSDCKFGKKVAMYIAGTIK